MKKFDLFFSKNGLLYASFIIAFAGLIFSMVMSLVSGGMSGFGGVVITGIVAAFVLVLFIAIKKHIVHLFYITSGCVLASLVIMVTSLIQVAIAQMVAGYEIALINSIINFVEIALVVLFMINHMIINSLHKPSRGNILFNQIIAIILMAYQIVGVVFSVVESASLIAELGATFDVIVYMITGILGYLSTGFIFVMICCAESKLNVYKAIREQSVAEGTWTEEKKEETKENVF